MNRRSFLSASIATAAIASPLAMAATASPKQSEYFRISVEKDDSGYIPYGKFIGDHRVPVIYLDGVKQDGCITADAREGWIKRIVMTDAGNAAAVHGEICTEIVHGKVVIEIPAAAHRSAA